MITSSSSPTSRSSFRASKFFDRLVYRDKNHTRLWENVDREKKLSQKVGKIFAKYQTRGFGMRLSPQDQKTVEWYKALAEVATISQSDTNAVFRFRGLFYKLKNMYV